jgi:tRNA-modifying protein YgfZ
MKAALLPDRGVIKLTGDDARTFLHGLVTADILHLQPGMARFCALLTPQGKIIADFFVVEASPADCGGFFLDAPRVLLPALIAKLKLYKLRAKVVIEDLSETWSVLAAWDGSGTTQFSLCYADPRLPALGTRLMLPPPSSRFTDALATLGATIVTAAEYEAHRIALGVPRGGSDFSYGDSFPHESDMDQLGGVDFTKGCYIGQEVVSRIEHRGVARARVVPLRYDATAPEPGSAVLAGNREVGTMGSSSGGHGLALIRLDRAAEAIASGEMLTVGGVPIRLVKPDWARFSFPGDSKAAE